jgi:hypothetical protein
MGPQMFRKVDIWEEFPGKDVEPSRCETNVIPEIDALKTLLMTRIDREK